MKKFLKIFLWTIVSLVLILGLLITGFIYKVQNGFPVFYETEIPAIDFPSDKKAILLFSKSTVFGMENLLKPVKKLLPNWQKKIIGFCTVPKKAEFLIKNSLPNSIW